MKISSVVRLPEGIVKFNGELADSEAQLVIELGLNYLIRAGAMPAVTAALLAAQKEEEAAMGYSDPDDEGNIFKFPEDMQKND
ncbi:MAG TPA: hypothetical protein VN843_36060 [Anaerolineales bacterium]|nr:hypothetical protein [Anaerolineales bacterium]